MGTSSSDRQRDITRFIEAFTRTVAATHPSFVSGSDPPDLAAIASPHVSSSLGPSLSSSLRTLLDPTLGPIPLPSMPQTMTVAATHSSLTSGPTTLQTWPPSLLDSCPLHGIRHNVRPRVTPRLESLPCFQDRTSIRRSLRLSSSWTAPEPLRLLRRIVVRDVAIDSPERVRTATALKGNASGREEGLHVEPCQTLGIQELPSTSPTAPLDIPCSNQPRSCPSGPTPSPNPFAASTDTEDAAAKDLCRVFRLSLRSVWTHAPRHGAANYPRWKVVFRRPISDANARLACFSELSSFCRAARKGTRSSSLTSSSLCPPTYPLGAVSLVRTLHDVNPSAASSAVAAEPHP